jgi:uncharacterized protein
MGLRFVWDDNKARTNFKSHGVSFDEAKAVFIDPLARIFDDETHSIYEKREIIVGHSLNNRVLLVCFTERGDAIRVISAREATKKERNDYEENIFH